MENDLAVKLLNAYSNINQSHLYNQKNFRVPPKAHVTLVNDNVVPEICFVVPAICFLVVFTIPAFQFSYQTQ